MTCILLYAMYIPHKRRRRIERERDARERTISNSVRPVWNKTKETIQQNSGHSHVREESI